MTDKWLYFHWVVPSFFMQHDNTFTFLSSGIFLSSHAFPKKFWKVSFLSNVFYHQPVNIVTSRLFFFVFSSFIASPNSSKLIGSVPSFCSLFLLLLYFHHILHLLNTFIYSVYQKLVVNLFVIVWPLLRTSFGTVIHFPFFSLRALIFFQNKLFSSLCWIQFFP